MTAKEYYEKTHPIDLGVITKDEAIKMMEEYANQWISVKDAPLFTIDENGNWSCTKAGDGDFLAAVTYKDSRQPDKELWWIRHCIIEDVTGLCVVGCSDNEVAGWEMSDIAFYKPTPNPPKQ